MRCTLQHYPKAAITLMSETLYTRFMQILGIIECIASFR